MRKALIAAIVAGVIGFVGMSWANCGSCGKEGGEGKHGDKGAASCEKGKCPKLFEGITLTADQQTKINELKAACTKEDCTKETREKCQTDIRAVLTAEQQVTFDKNLAAIKEAKAACHKHDGAKPAEKTEPA